MQNLKSKKLNIKNVPKGNNAVSKIYLRPNTLFQFLLFFSIVLILRDNTIVGLGLIGFSCYNLLFTKNKYVVEFYETYVLFHLENFDDEVYLLFYNEIESWSYINNNKGIDQIKVRLQGGKELAFNSYERRKMKKYMERYTKQKDINEAVLNRVQTN